MKKGKTGTWNLLIASRCEDEAEGRNLWTWHSVVDSFLERRLTDAPVLAVADFPLERWLCVRLMLSIYEKGQQRVLNYDVLLLDPLYGDTNLQGSKLELFF